MTARLRARMGQHAHDDRLTNYVAELSSASDHFRNIWASEHIAAYRHEEKTIHHPDAGILTLDCDVLAADNSELRLDGSSPRLGWSDPARLL